MNRLNFHHLITFLPAIAAQDSGRSNNRTRCQSITPHKQTSDSETMQASKTSSDQSNRESPGPVKAGERIVTLDILRGIALLGVLIVNAYLWFNGLWFLLPEYGEHLQRLSLDSVTFHAISAFAEFKAITTFSFLFGIGFALQMARAKKKSERFVPFFSRRMIMLFLIGVPHAIFLWYGDILMAYALIGLLLLLFRKAEDRTLLMWAGGLLLAVPLVFGALEWWVAAAGLPTLWVPQDIALFEGFRSSNVATMVATNVSVLVYDWTGVAIWYILGTYLAIFLIGFVVGRQRIYENVEVHHASFQRVRAWGLGVGIPVSIVYALMPWVVVPPEAWEAMPWLAIFFEFVLVASMIFLTAGYIATATLLVHDHEHWKRRLSIFAPVGRMALTNYIAQSVVCVLVFYGPFLGLMGQVGPTATLGISLAIFAVQIAWSHWWLARFRFGPLEWLWRVATYGKMQPMRVREAHL